MPCPFSLAGLTFWPRIKHGLPPAIARSGTGLALLRRAPLLPSGPFFLFVLLFVVLLLVGHIPTWQDYQAWGQALFLAPLLGVFDCQIDVVRVFDLPVVFALEFVGPAGIVLDDSVKVIEELPIRVHASTLYVGASTSNQLTIEESDSLQSLQATYHLLEGLVQFEHFPKQLHLHHSAPFPACFSLVVCDGPWVCWIVLGLDSGSSGSKNPLVVSCYQGKITTQS